MPDRYETIAIVAAALKRHHLRRAVGSGGEPQPGMCPSAHGCIRPGPVQRAKPTRKTALVEVTRAMLRPVDVMDIVRTKSRFQLVFETTLSTAMPWRARAEMTVSVTVIGRPPVFRN